MSEPHDNDTPSSPATDPPAPVPAPAPAIHADALQPPFNSTVQPASQPVKPDPAIDPATGKPVAAEPVNPGPPYDAVLVPRNYPKGKVEDARHKAIRDEFAPLLGDKKVYTRQCADLSFITPFKAGPQRCHRYWPRGHDNDGAEFYHWFDRGDGSGVMYGVLTEEAKKHVADGN